MFSLALTAAIMLGDEPSKDLDFWIGSWTMDSKQPGNKSTKGEWQPRACTNSVSKHLDGKVVQEKFKTKGFEGQSWSVYDSKAKLWKQTWVDDTGAYLLFEGGMNGSEFVLYQVNSQRGKDRMRFANITRAGFDWFWEHSDNGDDWQLNWHLRYHRKIG